MPIPRVSFNNQDTVLLSMFIPSNHTFGENIQNALCLLHDNRIFNFKRDNDDGKTTAKDSTSSPEQNIIMNILTTPKYRAMNAMYMLYHVLDNVLLASIIVLVLFSNGTLSPTTTGVNVFIYLAIGMEVFYDIMVNVNRYWILQRLSIHIGFMLYAIYTLLLILAIRLAGEETPNLTDIKHALVARFVIFIMEECVDIAIDFALHNDLVRLNRNKPTIEYTNRSSKSIISAQDTPKQASIQELDVDEKLPLRTSPNRSSMSDYLDVASYVEFPVEMNYQGSLFAWGPSTVFAKGAWTKGEISTAWIILLCLVPALFTVVLVFFLLLLCFIASFIPMMLVLTFHLIGIVCSDRKERAKVAFSGYWQEMTYF